jgi:multidrug efflux pump subunit AcrB
MSIPAFAVRQPVLVNLVAISAVVIGALVMSVMHRESLPTMPTSWGNVTTVYVGASPEEIEQLVTIPVENAVGDVDNIEKIWSRRRHRKRDDGSLKRDQSHRRLTPRCGAPGRA